MIVLTSCLPRKGSFLPLRSNHGIRIGTIFDAVFFSA